MNAADVLTAIHFARDQGQEPSLILDENSPLMDAARDVLKPRAPPGDTAELERNWLIQTGLLTPLQADKSVSLSQAITPSEVMQAYRIGARGLEKANDQAENFERLYYLMLQTLERLLETAEPLANYGWSAVQCDCDEARVYLQELIDSLRLEITTVRKALEGAEGKQRRHQGQKRAAELTPNDLGLSHWPC